MNDTSTLLDYSQVTRHDAQPFFKAGDYHTVKWIYRKAGDTYTGSALLNNKDFNIDGAENTYVIAGTTGSGIAGTTFYQLQAQLMKP